MTCCGGFNSRLPPQVLSSLLILTKQQVLRFAQDDKFSRGSNSVAGADFFFFFLSAGVVGVDVVIEDLDELGYDLVAF
jgi:hypothetical protein